MELIVIIPAAALVVCVGLILQKTANMITAQQELEQAEQDSRTSGWLLVVAAIACAVLVL
jgi:hypothetical protein